MRALITHAEVGALGRPCYAEDATLDALIAEAEREDVKPRIGDALYISLKTPTTEAGLTDAEKLLLNGGQWTDHTGAARYLSGLKTALAYFVYARVVRDGNLQVTRYGVKLKTDENSANAEDAERARQYRQAFASADAYLAEVLAYINDHKADYNADGDAVLRSNRTRFRVVGAGSDVPAGARMASPGLSGPGVTPEAFAALVSRVSSLETSVATLGRTKVDARYVDERVAPVRFTENSTYAEISEAYADGRSMLLDVSDDDLDVYAFSAYIDGIFYFSQITEGVIYVASYLEDEEPRFNSYNLTNN